MKKIFMICYDIQNDKRRNKVLRELLIYGIRTQYSVFECTLSEKEIKLLKKRLEKIINKKEDKIYLYPLSINHYKHIIRIGLDINSLPINDIFI